MSAMETMLGQMLKKALPQEVMELLAPEKLQEFGERINAFLTDVRNSQEQIITNQDAIISKLALIEERLDNATGDQYSANSGKSPRGERISDSGSDSGS